MYKIIGADGREYGPVSAEQLRGWIAEGRANGATQTLAPGAAEWKALGNIPEFSLFFAGPPPSISPRMPVRKTNGFAVAGFILGILSFCLCCCFPINVLALIFSIIGLAQIRGNRALYDGESMAIAGLALAGLSILLGIGLRLIGLLSTSWPVMHHVYRL